MSVRITVVGVDDTVAYFQRIASQIEPIVVKPSIEDWKKALRDAMIKREHFRSGRMRAMTQISQTGVVVNVGYAEEENMRPGNKIGKQGGGQGTPHQFVEPAMREVDQQQFNNIVAKLTQLLSSG